MADTMRCAVTASLLFCIAAGSGWVAPAAVASAKETASLDWLVGSWRGTGASFGQAGNARLQIRRALGGKFLELSYTVSTSGPRSFIFEGRAFYRPVAGGNWEAQWFDSRGMKFPISATLSDKALTSDWGAAEGEQGRTVYRILVDGRLEVVDLVQGQNGSWREFARYTYQKDGRSP